MNILYVVGIGPGGKSGMTFDADAAISSADIIVGYTKYIELIKEAYPEKLFYSTPMLKEKERCEKALSYAAAGKITAVVCSGDSGVYGMASLIFELAGEDNSVDIIIVPGVTAALSGAALLGSPLGHDFAVISLSDLLTPWETIEKRLSLAAEGDFCICLYNPSSRRRYNYLQKACDILLCKLPETTLCGIAQNIGRVGENKLITTLGGLRNIEVDMFSTVFIGNSETKLIGGKMVTPRGYKNV